MGATLGGGSAHLARRRHRLRHLLLRQASRLHFDLRLRRSVMMMFSTACLIDWKNLLAASCHIVRIS